MELLSHPMLQRDPTTAEVDAAHCDGCFECVQVCAYGAMERTEIRDRQGAIVRRVARVNPAVCEGCGVCTVTCRSGNIELQGCTEEQIFAQLGALAPVPR
jgi:heterodisulfide reductase subunit A